MPIDLELLQKIERCHCCHCFWGMIIHKSQLFWCELQGVLSHRWAIEIYYDILVSCKAPVAPCAQAAATPRVHLAFLEASEFYDSNHFQSAFCGKHVESFPQTLRWFFFSTCGCSSDWFFVLWQLLCATQLWVSNWSPNEVYQSPTHSESYSMASRTKIRTGPEDKNISTWYPLCPESWLNFADKFHFTFWLCQHEFSAWDAESNPCAASWGHGQGGRTCLRTHGGSANGPTQGPSYATWLRRLHTSCASCEPCHSSHSCQSCQFQYYPNPWGNSWLQTWPTRS